METLESLVGLAGLEEIAPEQVDLALLWQQWEPVLATLAPYEQLALGGTLIERLAELHHAKAEALFDQWQAVYDPQEPTLEPDWLQGLVRSSQQVSLGELVAPVRRRRSALEPESTEAESLVAAVDKAQVLAMVDDLEAAQQIGAIAHDESVGVWVGCLQGWFEQYPDPIELRQLQAGLGWPLVQLWLALLLGGFELRPVGQGFYTTAIWVGRGCPT